MHSILQVILFEIRAIQRPVLTSNKRDLIVIYQRLSSNRNLRRRHRILHSARQAFALKFQHSASLHFAIALPALTAVLLFAPAIAFEAELFYVSTQIYDSTRSNHPRLSQASSQLAARTLAFRLFYVNSVAEQAKDPLLPAVEH
uniref:Uncharacterized protein n=1 Tax=Glossina pallidipes TaxID=7398 RepID=A0A1A9Z575_GLOPL